MLCGGFSAEVREKKMRQDGCAEFISASLKPAYNLQYGVEASFIVWAGVYPNPTDTRTLIPFLEDFHAYIGKRSRKLVADAGYESEENYLYLREKGQTSYIKPNNYDVSKKRKWKQDIGRRENTSCLAAEDVYQCAEGRANVLGETILLALAHNVFKLHQKIQGGTLERHLVPLRAAA